MKIIKIKESFKPFKARNKDFWTLSWRKDVEDEGTSAIMFTNSIADQEIRLEETKNKEYKVEIWENGKTISSNIFAEFEEAKDYVITYMGNVSKPESLTSKIQFNKLFMKTMVEHKTLKEKASERSIEKENHLFHEMTEEYIRALNLIIDNNNIEKDVIDKSKKIRDFIIKIYK